MGVYGDPINLGARLMGEAGQDEIHVSNTFYGALSDSSRDSFQELEPFDAKNMGRIKSWASKIDLQQSGCNAIEGKPKPK